MSIILFQRNYFKWSWSNTSTYKVRIVYFEVQGFIVLEVLLARSFRRILKISFASFSLTKVPTTSMTYSVCVFRSLLHKIGCIVMRCVMIE